MWYKNKSATFSEPEISFAGFDFADAFGGDGAYFFVGDPVEFGGNDIFADIFGIGALTLENAHTVAAPTGFTARELTYTVPDFRNKKVR